MTVKIEKRGERTQSGNYFISNYPPYSFWTSEQIPLALDALDRPHRADHPLGLYIHIPFCRKRCHFCYFKIYTRKNSREIRQYLKAAVSELDLYLEREFVGGRDLEFVYIGGGTPSALSTTQFRDFVENLKKRLPWSHAREVTMECEPGTLTRKKLEVIRSQGITRLSLGVENFDDQVLSLNGRAHGAEEIDRAWKWIQEQNFPQVNIDLIAGMLGETEENWQSCVDKALQMRPESITIYQMEIPFNTTFSRRIQEDGGESIPVADWPTKRRWVDGAFRRLEEAGYDMVSAYTAVRPETPASFVYRDSLWQGADLLSLGVASFGHLNGVHVQNESSIETYQARLQAGELPIARAFVPNGEERLIRELILQLKLGRVEPAYFSRKFDVEIRERFKGQFSRLQEQGYLKTQGPELELTREGLLRVDGLLPSFFLPRHRNSRYT